MTQEPVPGQQPDPRDSPAVRAGDAEREATVTRLQAAVGEGRIDLDEFGQRAGAAYAAATTAELDALLADLPAPASASPAVGELVGERTPAAVVSVFGDIKVAATTSVPERASTVFGDVRIDLRGMRTSAEVVELELGTVFGDVEVIVSEGVAAEIAGWTVFGDRKTELAAVPRLAGTPRVVVRARTLFGDLRLRSLAPGESPSRWRAVLDRLADRRPPPPPPRL
ncbi:DUF1707 SHOCT-like domain-containing protein [Modestobacter versicolor]|uniref:DUF1707 domain-containing protein n=1 Tax=Modestobacter versicolor TaxID=429133 RepID=A0A323V858_9ACTN|nr:DUF1707 domain-containing protein [Modestobacter versicolor]MBB3676486.1 hypothetical protein [Modestobacter versicolor]PZA20741.1 hypothetical protein DMO24_13880 [Modestobacter versicolor]